MCEGTVFQLPAMPHVQRAQVYDEQTLVTIG